MESKELAIRLARALDAKKAVNVHILAVEDLTTVTEVFLYYAAGWLSVSVESVSVLSLSAVDSDAMMSVTWLEPSRLSFFCASSASAIRPPICWIFGSVAV